MNLKKIVETVLVMVLGILAVAPKSLAFCPICTIAVASGVGLSRWLGVDDAITGLWIGAFATSAILWTNNWFKRKGVKFPGFQFITTLLYLALVLIPLYKYEILGHEQNRLWGIDKLVLGMAIGSASFLAGVINHAYSFAAAAFAGAGDKCVACIVWPCHYTSYRTFK